MALKRAIDACAVCKREPLHTSDSNLGWTPTPVAYPTPQTGHIPHGPHPTRTLASSSLCFTFSGNVSSLRGNTVFLVCLLGAVATDLTDSIEPH
jgi:hypothetical protein